MNNNNFSQALERISQLQYQERLPSKLIRGSHALLFLEHYRLRAVIAKKANFIASWLNSDLAGLINQKFCIENNKHINIEPISVYRYELFYLNWEFHEIDISKDININISNLPNPYEPMLIFLERGGGFTFSPPSHFNIGEIVIRKPKFEKIVDLPPFITFNESSYKSADDEYIKDKAAFFEKYIRPIF